MADNNTGMLDLTAIARPDLRVKAKVSGDREKVYRFPGDPPSGPLLRLVVLLQELESCELEHDDIEELQKAEAISEEIGEVLDDLLGRRNADYEPGEFRPAQPELVTLIGWLFAQYRPEAGPEEDGDRPTEPEEEPDQPEEEPSSTPPRQRSERRSRATTPRKPRASRSSTSSST